MLLQILWSFEKFIDMYADISIAILYRNQELWTSDYIIKSLHDWCLLYIPFNILFLTSNYICQTIYYKV